MNTKKKESMSLKESKQSKYLVGIYIDQLEKDNNLAGCLYSLANQTLPVDVVLFVKGLNAEEVSRIKQLAEKPFVSYIERDEQNQVVDKIINSEKSVNYTIIETSEVMSLSKIFNTTFNLALESGYEAISIAEPEDGYSVKWFETADIYMSENTDIAIFTPIIRNVVNGAFSGVMNESPWVEGMSEEAGKFDLNLLQRFNCANPLGAVYRVESIDEYAEKTDNISKPMKESMKLSHYYEFFLRMIYDDVKIMTIPRMGYEIKTVNKDYFTDSSCKIPQNLAVIPEGKGGMNPDEARFWFELAKKEFFYDEDRNKVYELSA
jgi:hypothetical protein